MARNFPLMDMYILFRTRGTAYGHVDIYFLAMQRHWHSACSMQTISGKIKNRRMRGCRKAALIGSKAVGKGVKKIKISVDFLNEFAI